MNKAELKQAYKDAKQAFDLAAHALHEAVKGLIDAEPETPTVSTVEPTPTTGDSHV